MTPIPGASGSYLVFEQGGNLWVVRPDGARSPFLKVTGRCMNALFHRDFPQVPLVYLRYSSQAINRLVRYDVSKAADWIADPRSATPIIEWPSRGHRGGDLAFGTDGYLYIAAGDGEKWGDPHNTAQDTDTLHASILRIDVDHHPYDVPPDNPFVGVAGVRPEIWAYGLRNPWRFTFRPGTNELWVGDNGDENWEMVHRVTKGTNHGWSRFEGSRIFRPSNPLKGPAQTHTPPIMEHSHREMRSVIGGRWYVGEKFPELRDHYVYGCHITGKLWAFAMEGDTPTQARTIADVGGQIVSFAEDPEGELLIVTLDRGIFRMERAPATASRPVPQRLSDTGLFADIAAHKAGPGLLPYDLNLSAYRDHAVAERYVGIPPGKPIHIRHAHRKADLLPPIRSRIGLDRWTLEAGTTIMQTLSLHGRRIETQISMNDAGVWRFLSYRWNTEQTDAELVPEAGAEVELADGKPWRFPSRAECAACHTHVTGFVPGVNLAQLNRSFDYHALGGKPMNQILMFRELGFLPKNYRLPAKELVVPQADDESASLEDRARAYLHVNCSHCHRETGLGGRADFSLVGWMTNEGSKVIGGMPLVGLPDSAPATRLLVPGFPQHSDIYRRMATDGPGRMPLFGTSTVDKEGAELIRRWIESMED
ncbi:MAG: glucose/arabinose dehydrogenase/mono/diheme cytochrome c family protein [Rhodothermales bacterium]|jgi:glucose/arabinose dehydrogenase/mono/diheme cytochrome c family protein